MIYINYIGQTVSPAITLDDQNYVYLFISKIYDGLPIGIFDSIEILHTTPARLINFYLVNDQGDKIHIKEKISPDSLVYTGDLNLNTSGSSSDGIPVVIKITTDTTDIFTTERGGQSSELGIWLELQKIGLDLPKFYHGFYFLGFDWGILVIEELEKLSSQDKPLEIGRQIIPQLQILHQMGIHNDLKPDNILRKGHRYYMIDYEFMALSPYLYGYWRTAYTPIFTSQVNSTPQVTTGKKDLLEIGYTMNSLLIEEISPRGEEVKYMLERLIGLVDLPVERLAVKVKTFKPRTILYNYIERVMLIDQRHILHTNYTDLIAIIQ